jgi:DNA-directed RNA polymerase specialized sigma24 family protein
LSQNQSVSLDTPLSASGEGEMSAQLFTQLYAALRRIAHRELNRGGSSLTLGATTLLHEADLNMQAPEGLQFSDRPRFLAYASRAMRGLIIDYARNRQALKWQAAFETTSLATDAPELAVYSSELQQLSEAIERLAVVEPSSG